MMIHSYFMGIFIYCGAASKTAICGQQVEFGLLQTGQLRAVIAQHTPTPSGLSFKPWGRKHQLNRQTTNLAESAQLLALLQQVQRPFKPINQNVAMPTVPHAPHLIELGVRFMAQPRAPYTAQWAQWFDQQISLIHGHLARRAQAATAVESQSAVHFARANYQLSQYQLPDFMQLVERLQQDFPHLRLQATGPWPPYSFPQLWVANLANS
jgi:hypothetical protein